MAINSNIALGVEPIKIDSPLNSLAQIYQIKSAQQAGDLGQMKMDEYQRDVQSKNTLRDYFKTGDQTSPDFATGLGAIDPKYMQEFQKSKLEQQKSQGDIDKNQLEIATKRHAAYQNTLGSLAYSTNLTKDAVVQAGNGLVDAGILKPETLQAQLASLSDDPVKLRQQLLQSLATQLSPDEKMKAFSPKPTQMDNGQSVSFRDTNPNSPTYGQMTGGASMPKMQSPESIASNVTAQRGQDMSSATAAAGRAQSAQQFNVTQAGGKTPPGYRANPDGSLVAIPGGPADLKINAEAVKKVADAKDVLGLLDQVDILLPKATGGFLGTGVDLAASAVGKSTQGALATAQLKAVQGALVSKMPKMSGPQSDKDVLLYREMAGQVGDSTIPVAQRQAAANMVRQLNEKYAGMQPGASVKPPVAAKPTASPQTYSDADKEARYLEYKANQK
jgi:hypothetical protein